MCLNLLLSVSMILASCGANNSATVIDGSSRLADRHEYKRLVREGMDGLTAPRIVAQFDKDVHEPVRS